MARLTWADSGRLWQSLTLLKSVERRNRQEGTIAGRTRGAVEFAPSWRAMQTKDGHRVARAIEKLRKQRAEPRAAQLVLAKSGLISFDSSQSPTRETNTHTMRE